MVFEFLRKKLQEIVGPGADAPADGGAAPGRQDYEERRKAAETLHAEGRTDEAVALLEALAEDLAGEGSFPLAVAVRYQIQAWKPGAESETPDEGARKMAARRDETGPIRAPGRKPGADVPAGIREAPLLADLDASEIAALIESTGRRSYAAGDVVVEEGRPGTHLYIVTRGALAVSTRGAGGDPVPVGTLTVGDAFGEVAILTGRPRAATIVAESEAECLEISEKSWATLVARHPRLSEVLETTMRERASLAAEAVVDAYRRRKGEGA